MVNNVHCVINNLLCVRLICDAEDGLMIAQSDTDSTCGPVARNQFPPHSNHRCSLIEHVCCLNPTSVPSPN